MNDVDPKSLETVLAKIRAQADAENIRVTQHAQQEMAEENITLNQVLEAIASGQILKLSRTSERHLLSALRSHPESSSTACCVYNNTTDTDHYHRL